MKNTHIDKDSVTGKSSAAGGGIKQFYAFVKKEFFHIWRDKRTLFILLGIPITQIIIFGFALTNEVKNSKIAILDLSKEYASQQLIQKISASKYFDYDQCLNAYNEIDPAFKKSQLTHSAGMRKVTAFPSAKCCSTTVVALYIFRSLS